MIINKIKSFTNTALVAVLVICCFSCNTNLYDTYKDYSGGNVVSVAKPDSLSVVQGNGRLSFTVYLNADPKIKKGFITWDAGNNEKTFDINRTVFQRETLEVEVIAVEGTHEFTVYLEDASGNKSVKTTYLATVLGEEYRTSLPNRGLDVVEVYSGTEAIITWRANNNDLLVKTEVTYTDSVDGLEKTIEVSATDSQTIVPNFQSEGTFSYKTTYKASANSSDVFITDATQGVFPVKP